MGKQIYQVLVVDDESFHIKQIQNILPKEEFRLLRAINGAHGCIIAEERQPDLIVMDWQMPEMNGIEALHVLKKNTATQDIPVIIATGVMTDSEYLAVALGAGAVDFLEKPFNPIELTARIHAALQLSNALKKIKKKNQLLEAQQNEIRVTNDDLLDQVQLLEYAYEEKNNLLAMLGREIVTPINHIKGVTRLIGLAGSINTKQQAYLEAIHKDLATSENLLQEIIDIEKIELEDWTFHIASLQPQQVIKELLSQTDLATAQCVQQEFEEPIQADEQSLKHISQKLLDFSKLYGKKEHRPSFILALEKEHWTLQFSQPYCTLSEMDIHALFLKYNQLHSLYFVKILVVQLDGNLTWELEGTTFRITIFLPKSYSSIRAFSSEEVFTEEEAIRLYEQLLQKIEVDEIYKDPDLTLDTLGDTINISGRKLSMLIQQKRQENFKTFINHYRVEEAKKLLSDDKYSHYTFLGICYEAGFNSKSAFYRHFKQFTGLTPTVFQEQYKSQP
jgi:YesN/AraC family two-component response regulator